MSESTRGRARRPIVAPRGRGRRSEADRARILDEEKARTRARETQYAAEVAAQDREDERKRRFADRGRGDGRRRGRGGFMGDRPEFRGSGGLTSSLSSSAASKTLTKPRPSGSSPERARKPQEGLVKIKTEGGTDENLASMASASRTALADYGGYISSDEDTEMNGPRQDIDTINANLQIDSKGDIEGTKKLQLGARPVRLIHRPHKDRAVQVNTENEQATGRDGHQGKGGEKVEKYNQAFGGPEPEWFGAWSDGVDGRELVDQLAHNHGERREQQGVVDEADLPQDKTAKVRQRRKQPQGQLVFQTEEDRLEHQRRVEKLSIIAAELQLTTPSVLPSKEGEAVEDAADEKADRVYLFQFPPNLPGLHPSTQDGKQAAHETQPVLKTEASLEEGSASKQDAAVKIEDGEGSKPAIDMSRPFDLPQMTAGKAGKLKLHKSGKVTVEWAGARYKLSLGLQSSCVQEMVMLDVPKDRLAKTAGAAIPFGQVRGKYVVTPDWDALLPTLHSRT